MATPDTLRLVHTFDAPVERVFRAWSDAQELRQWAWGSLGREVEAEVDFRTGGGFRISTKRDEGEPWIYSGSYLEILPNRRLVHTVEWSAPMGYEAQERVTVEFSGSDDKTEVVFLHEGLPDVARRDHEKGWTNTFQTLDDVLKKKR